MLIAHDKIDDNRNTIERIKNAHICRFTVATIGAYSPLNSGPRFNQEPIVKFTQWKMKVCLLSVMKDLDIYTLYTFMNSKRFTKFSM